MGFILNRRKKLNKYVTLTASNTGLGAVLKLGPVSVSSRGRVTVHLGKGMSYRLFG